MNTSSVYGPVGSWRLGRSLGVDLLAVDSICSFRCVYCQLGQINQHTRERAIFVTTERVMEDLYVSDWEGADAVTFSGSGEPTLALNLGEAMEQVKAFTGKPVVVLTNSTMLESKEVRRELGGADRVFCKLDAWSEDMLRRINRPSPGITLAGIVEGIRLLRQEFDGELAVQTMLLRSFDEADCIELAELLNRIGPDEIQLNVPSRPVPESFSIDNRENLAVGRDSHVLRTLSHEELLEARVRLARLVSCDVLCRGLT